MKQKVIFLDVDGTIYDEKGEIPQSTRRAIALAHDKKHLILLCTGRSYSEIGAELWDLKLDGMIGSAGAFIYFRDKILFHRPMKLESVHDLLDFLERKNIPYVLETNEAIYGKAPGLVYVDRIIQDRLEKNPNLAPDFLGEIRQVEDCYGIDEVNKILFFDAPFSNEEMKQQLEAEYTMVPNSVAQYGKCSGEVSEKGMSKAKGIERFLAIEGLEREDTFAFGDGANDMEMIQYVQTGIAMGNAVNSLKKKADYITGDVGQDGIYEAFEKFGLI